MAGKMLGVRLPNNILNKLESIANAENDSMNQTAKKALIEWIEILFTSRHRQMAIFPKTALVKMILYMNEAQIQEIGKVVGGHIADYYQYLFTTHQKHLKEEYIYGLIERYLGPKGLMWFDHLEFAVENTDICLFQGTHSLDLSWGKFMLFVLAEMFDQFLSRQIIHESLIITTNNISFQLIKWEENP